MATATQRTQETTEEMSKDVERFAQNLAPSFEAMMKANAQAGQIWMEQLNNISNELITFTNNRLSHDMEVMQRLSNCRDPFQAMQIQSECLQTASKQYIEETGKIAEMATEASMNCFKQMDQGLRDATRNVERSSKSDGSSSSGGSGSSSGSSSGSTKAA